MPELATTLALCATLLSLLLFIVFYATRSNWRFQRLGKIIMYQKVCLSAYFASEIVTRQLPDSSVAEWLRVLFIVLVASATWLMLVRLLRVQDEESKR